jgi:hypothetical protein
MEVGSAIILAPLLSLFHIGALRNDNGRGIKMSHFNGFGSFTLSWRLDPAYDAVFDDYARRQGLVLEWSFCLLFISPVLSTV